VGRRVQMRVETWDPNGLDWDFKSARRFVWYNWFMIEELAADPNGVVDGVVRKYTWGLDPAGQNGFVIPAQAGIQHQAELGPRLRGGDAQAGLGRAADIGAACGACGVTAPAHPRCDRTVPNWWVPQWIPDWCLSWYWLE
jgi:hypothetical protein